LLENEKIVYEKINSISSEKFKFLTVFPYLLFSLLIQKNINHPITILSCDNIQNNGKVIKNSLVSFIKLIDV
jgi:mannitol-1-phosphate/altronate dehydrogenase